MADKSLFSLPLDELDAYTAGVKESKDLLDGITNQWKAAARAIKECQVNVKDVNDAMKKAQAGAGANDNLRDRIGPPPSRNDRAPSQNQNSPNSQLKKLNDTMVSVRDTMTKRSLEMARQIGSYGGGGTSAAIGGVENVLSSLGKSNVVAAVVSMAAAAVSAPLLAAFAAAPEVASLRRQAMGLSGLNIGTLRAANAAGSWMDDPMQGIRAEVSARRNMGGPQFQAFSMGLGGVANAQASLGKGSGVAQFELLDKVVEKMDKLPERMQDAFGERFSAVFNLNTIRAYQAMDKGERRQHREMFEDTARRTAMSPEDAKAWQFFYDKMRNAGEIMESGIIKRLTPLTGPLGDMSIKFAKWVDDSKTLDTVFSDLTGTLKTNADQIKAIVDFLKPVVNVVGSLFQTASDALTASQKWVAEHGLKLVEHETDPNAKRAMPGMLPGGVFNSDNYKPGMPLGPAAPPTAPAAPPPPLTQEEKGRASGLQRLKGLLHHSAYEGGGGNLAGGGSAADLPIEKTGFISDTVDKIKEVHEAYSDLSTGLTGTGLSLAGVAGAARTALPYARSALPGLAGGAATAGIGTAASVMWPTPTGNGELPSKFIPQKAWDEERRSNAANKPTAEGQNVAFETGNVGGGWKLPGKYEAGTLGGVKAKTTDEPVLSESKKTNELLTQIKDGMDTAAGVEGAHGGVGGGHGLGFGGGGGSGGDGGAGEAAGGSGAYLAGHFGGGGGGAPAGVRMRASGGGGGGGGAGPSMTGGSGGGYSGGRVKSSKDAQKTAAMVAEKFRVAGASDEGIAGMFKNVQDEGGFGNAGSRHFDQPKFRGTEAENAHGLWQMGGTEWNQYDSWMKKNRPGGDWKDPANQADWQIQNLQTRYPKLWAKMKTHAPAGEQAGDFTQFYERPSKENLNRRKAEAARGVPGIEAYTGGAGGGASGPTKIGDTKGLKYKSPEAHAGGKTSAGLSEFSAWEQANDPNFRMITAENDAWHHAHRPTSDHTRGMAGDYGLKGGMKGIVESNRRAEAELKRAGLKPSEYYIEPAEQSKNHMHVSLRGAGSAKYAAFKEAERSRMAKADSKRDAVAQAAPSSKEAVQAAMPRKGNRGWGTEESKGGYQGGGEQTASNAPLHMGNWQLQPKTNVALSNKTGGDVHISASTMAG